MSTPEGVAPLSPEAMATHGALEALAATLQSVGADLSRLLDRLQHLRHQIEDGRPLVQVMQHEERPLIVTTLTRVLDELADAGATLRRAEARQLRTEGLSQTGIAEVFGVTRQRAAALLAPPPPPGARAAKRPPGGEGRLHSI